MEAFYEFDPDVIGTKGLVLIGDKMLVYRRDTKTDKFPLLIDLPGGGREPGETPFQTFQREVREEFGLEITPDDISYVRAYPSIVDPTKNAYFPVAALPETAADHIKFGNEGVEYMLMSVEEYLAAEVAWPEFKVRVRDWLAAGASRGGQRQ